MLVRIRARRVGDSRASRNFSVERSGERSGMALPSPGAFTSALRAWCLRPAGAQDPRR